MKPMLCHPAKLEEARIFFNDQEWIIEEKYDGIRAYIEHGKLYDRRGKEITHKFPEFVGMEKLPGVFDGEIICETFSDVQSRVHTKDKFVSKLLALKKPALFMAFDFVEQSSLDVRKERLSKFDGFAPWFRVVQASINFDSRWNEVMAHGGEGMVLKRLSAQYQPGVRSRDWLKVKAFEETTAIFTKLEVHPKGVRLETDDGHSVNVNGEEAQYVKELFDVNGSVTCDVQFMRIPDSAAWRFPSFRGINGKD